MKEIEKSEEAISLIKKITSSFLLELEHPEFYNMSELVRRKDKKIISDIEKLKEINDNLQMGNYIVAKKSTRKIEEILKDFKSVFGYETKEARNNDRIVLIHEKEELFIDLKEKNFFKENRQSGSALIINLEELELINEIFEISFSAKE